MGFATVITSITGSMLSSAQGFITDFAPLVALITGIALAGYTLVVLRRFLT